MNPSCLFLPFSKNESDFPGAMSENFVPSFGPNNFPNFDSSFSFPTYGNNERSAFKERYSSNFPDTSFETPIRNPPFSVAKRSELAGYGYEMPFPFYLFLRPTVPLVRNYRSVDFYDDEDYETKSEGTRTKREIDDNYDDFYFFDKKDMRIPYNDVGYGPASMVNVKSSKNDR